MQMKDIKAGAVLLLQRTSVYEQGRSRMARVEVIATKAPMLSRGSSYAYRNFKPTGVHVRISPTTQPKIWGRYEHLTFGHWRPSYGITGWKQEAVSLSTMFGAEGETEYSRRVTPLPEGEAIVPARNLHAWPGEEALAEDKQASDRRKRADQRQKEAEQNEVIRLRTLAAQMGLADVIQPYDHSTRTTVTNPTLVEILTKLAEATATAKRLETERLAERHTIPTIPIPSGGNGRQGGPS